MNDDVEGWTDNRRPDGLTVWSYGGGFFAVCNAQGDILTAECPCRDRSLRTPRAAKLVANELYPIKELPQ